MSGSASRGTRRRAQLPASTRNSVLVKTRNLFPAHQSIHREITAHPRARSLCAAFRHYGEVFFRDGLTILRGKHSDLPRSEHFDIPRTFVEPAALVAERKDIAHGRHAHRGHRGHEEG